MYKIRYVYICPECILFSGCGECGEGDALEFTFDFPANGTLIAGEKRLRVKNGKASAMLSRLRDGEYAVSYTEGGKECRIHSFSKSGGKILPDESGTDWRAAAARALAALRRENEKNRLMAERFGKSFSSSALKLFLCAENEEETGAQENAKDANQ